MAAAGAIAGRQQIETCRMHLALRRHPRKTARLTTRGDP